MLLKELATGLDYTLVQGKLSVDIKDIYYDSRKVVTGGLFVCIVGTVRDSHDFAAEVVRKGAVALVIQHDLPAGVLAAMPDVTVLQFSNTRYAMAMLSAALFDHPARAMTMIGVTGTKGKTTTTHMIRAVLTAAGHKVGMVGTNGVYWPGHHHDLNNTTPESYELQKILREMADRSCDACVMEVSSQGLMMDRVAGIHYKVGVFTNLYPDHIGPGEHASFEEYRAWKGELFKRCDVGVVNADDENTRPLLLGHTCRLVTYGMADTSPAADYRAARAYRLLRTKTMLGVAFALTEPDGRGMEVEVGMPGLFSIYNALATIGMARALNIGADAIREGLRTAVVKGRVELVPISEKFTILIDYAHNEAAAESLLETLRAYRPNRLVVLFGCGGNRSVLRRYGMGEVCSKMADFCILTEDNNRYEKVEDILADIKKGIAKGRPDVPFVEIPDRLDALHYAIDNAQAGDLIAVIGKGHETYRDRMGVKTPFLERELIEEYAAARGVE